MDEDEGKRNSENEDDDYVAVYRDTDIVNQALKE